MRSAVFVIASVLVLAIAIGAPSGRVIARETPPFNLEVILRDVTGGSGFGHVKFRQPNDGPQIVYLDTWVRDLAPNRSYSLQRAVDTTLDGLCSSSGWLTLGKGPDAQSITTDDDGTGREALWRSLAMLQAGATFDIHFQVAPTGTTYAVLKSGCYRFTVR
jgi:hypothetical protein